MAVHHDEDFPAAVAILLAGMLAPAVVAAVARDFLSMYVTASQFVLCFAVTFGLISWGFIERWDIDRTTFLLVSVAWPWPVLLAFLFVFVLLNYSHQLAIGSVTDVFRYLAGRSFASFFGYGALFMVAGTGAVALSKRYDDYAAKDDRVPGVRLVFASIGVAVVLTVILVAGANYSVANSATMSAVEPGLDDRRPALNVIVEGRPAELRVTATAPDGTSVTKRLSRVETRGGTGTVSFSVGLRRAADLPAQTGTYEVRVTSLAGATVDTAEYWHEQTPEVTISNVVVGSGDIDRRELPETTVNLTPTSATRLAVAVDNPSAFHTIARVTIRAPDTYANSFDLRIQPGERAAVVFSIPDEAAHAIEDERGGVLIVEVNQDGRAVDNRTVELPPA